MIQAVTEALPISQSETSVIITLTSFAVAAQDVQTEDIQSQNFSAVIERAFADGIINSSDLTFDVHQNAIASITVLAMAMQLPPNVDHIRITNAVYLNDPLFQPRDERSEEVGSLIISTSFRSIEDLNLTVLLSFTKNPVRIVIAQYMYVTL